MTLPLSLYLHLPWCVRKCPYCDFNSHTAGEDAPRSRYIDALCRDLQQEARHAAGRALQSIFLGGGTPSLFSGAEIGRILDAVRERFALAADIEITMEANPGSVERHNLRGYREAGVNRLSLGAQSFDDSSLQGLGRIHSAADISAAFRDARAAGFDNVNLDLMFALPGQTLAMACADVERALELAPEHLSYYQLTLEPNTVFFARPPADLPDDDDSDAMQRHGQVALAAAGYRQYEISAFARPGRDCRHNLNYWTFGDYLAAGAGAHGKITTADGRIRRYRKPDNPRLYMEHMERNGATGPMLELAAADTAFEYMLNVLRLPRGFSERDFSERTGLPPAMLREELVAAVAAGLMEQPSAGCWRPSERGLRFLNDLQAHFLPPDAAG
jgi:oxygen-independent coproporphyrinogen-3 oxidase